MQVISLKGVNDYIVAKKRRAEDTNYMYVWMYGKQILPETPVNNCLEHIRFLKIFFYAYFVSCNADTKVLHLILKPTQ